MQYLDISCFTESEVRLLYSIAEKIDASDPIDFVNTLLINFASCVVLSDLDGVIKAAGIAESLHETFKGYFSSILKSNIESMMPEPPFTEIAIPIPDEAVREAVSALLTYFCNLRQHVSNDVLNMMSKRAECVLNSTLEALSELYSQIPNERSNMSESEFAEIVENVAKKHKVPSLYSDFQIIIMNFDLFPFNYNKFKTEFRYKLNDPSIDSVELQRRYLISTLKTNSTYDKKKALINEICNAYQSTMERVKSEIKSESKRIKSLYGGTTENLVEFTNSLISEL